MVLYDVGGTTTYPLDNVENFFITHTYGGFDTMCFDINPQHELYPFISEEIKIGYGDNIYLVKGINERKRVSTITLIWIYLKIGSIKSSAQKPCHCMK